MKNRTCSDCGESNESVLSNDLCEDCESNYTYCEACKDWQHDEVGSTCRHLFWLDGGVGWAGAGKMSDLGDGRDFKESFFAVLDMTGFAKELRVAMRATYCRRGRWEGMPFYFRFHGSVLGTEGLDCELMGVSFGDRFHRLYKHENPELLHAGIAWLVSLWPSNPGTKREGWLAPTREACAHTVKWIDEYLLQEKKAA